MRGKVSDPIATPITTRITPAYAGKSFVLLYELVICKDHPCVCGEKNDFLELFCHD